MALGGLSHYIDTIAKIKRINGIEIPEELYLIFYNKNSLLLITDEVFSKSEWKDFFYQNKLKEEIILNHILLLSKESKKNSAMSNRSVDLINYEIGYD